MAIITVSRGSFSGGTLIARGLADRLGLRLVDRDVIVEKAAAYGISQEALRSALEKPPSFWDRLRGTKYAYLTLIQAALTDELRQGRAVYHGNAGHLLLRGVDHVLRIRIIAPLAFRVAMVQDRVGMSQEEALAHVARMDQDRRKWTQFLYGVDWGDPALYDLVVNLEALDVGQACEVIASAAGQGCFAETPDAQAAMNDLALASRVRASLLVAPATTGIEVEVVARGGSVSIRGRMANVQLVKNVERVARQVPGVDALDLDLFTDVEA
jgi:cytidylate kinase